MDKYGDDGRGSAALPVISGTKWFGPRRGKFVLRMEQPVTFDEMVAVLYGVAELDEIASDEDLCGCVVVTLLIEGLPSLQARAAKLRSAEKRGTVESAAFLALCRQRVAALIGE
jgi:hypothetical protein